MCISSRTIESVHDYVKNIIFWLTNVFKCNQTLLFMNIFLLLESMRNIYRILIDLRNLKNLDSSSLLNSPWNSITMYTCTPNWDLGPPFCSIIMVLISVVQKCWSLYGHMPMWHLFLGENMWYFVELYHHCSPHFLSSHDMCAKGLIIIFICEVWLELA